MGTFLTKEKLFSPKWFKAYALILAGALIIACGYVYFITPYRIVPGGLFGISIILHYTINTPVGVTALAMSIPLTIIAIKILGPRFGGKTIFGFVMTSVFIDLLTFITDENKAKLVNDDALLSGIYGGVLIGVGVGLIFKAKASAGGTDMIAMILSKYTKLPVAQLLMMVDSTIVLASLIAFGDWHIPLIALLVIFIVGKVIDAVLQGFSYNKALFIISDKHELIRNKLVEDMNRGGTLLSGTGMYKGLDKNIVFTALNRRESEIMKDYILQIDPDAFLTIINAAEVLGSGFKSLKDSVG